VDGYRLPPCNGFGRPFWQRSIISRVRKGSTHPSFHAATA
jgi:hypothetical protein